MKRRISLGDAPTRRACYDQKTGKERTAKSHPCALRKKLALEKITELFEDPAAALVDFVATNRAA